ncbi:AzlC family ABC transporter permease [Umezawaea sp. Da 62-37]|uniref:AzlC family ABC transporter permease n=1 Tax=Umezawaea sp. Da 62-37 TaxID=3075927 RepID=UPI0028F72649|nr:AzlC family ABC transporter permease [Umezawaea sp. Da 62-37]WNV85517.1 AzlC family ABC transporter permease [Umezawaea sp. Da 62-37]
MRTGRLQAIAPVAAAAFLFGVTFGVVATAAGFSVPAALVMSATTFGGAAQIGAASVLGASGGAAGAILTGVLLNLRYLPMGVTAAGAYRGPWWSRAAQAQLLGDETWALSRTPDGKHDSRLLLMSGAAVYVVWLAGTALGAISLGSVGDVSAWGLDMVSPAIFFALLWKQLTTARARIAAGASVAVALALVPFTPSGVPIAVASLVCLIGLAR